MSIVSIETDVDYPVIINGIICKMRLHDSRTGGLQFQISWSDVEKLHNTGVALKNIEADFKKNRNSKKIK